MIHCAEITANKQTKHQTYTVLNLLPTGTVNIEGILSWTYCQQAQ